MMNRPLKAQSFPLYVIAKDAILNKLEPFIEQFKEADSCHNYLLKKKARLNYPHFRKMGLCTSSSIVESGCRHVIGVRVKQSVPQREYPPGLHRRVYRETWIYTLG